MSTRTSNWSDDPTEEQILKLFNSTYSFKVLRALMKNSMTVPEMAQIIGVTHYDRVYAAVKSLRKIGLIKIKEKYATEQHSTQARLHRDREGNPLSLDVCFCRICKIKMK